MFARTFLALVALAAVASAAHHSWTGLTKGKNYYGQSTCTGTAGYDMNITSVEEIEGEAGCFCWHVGLRNFAGFQVSYWQKSCVAECASNIATFNIDDWCTDSTCGTCGKQFVQTRPTYDTYVTSSDLYKCSPGTENGTAYSFIFNESTSTNADAFLEFNKHSLEKSGVAGCAASVSSAAGASAAFFAVLAALAVMF